MPPRSAWKSGAGVRGRRSSGTGWRGGCRRCCEEHGRARTNTDQPGRITVFSSVESPCQSVKVRVSVFSLPPARVAPPTGAGAPLVDDREVPYDLLVSIPTHKGAAFLGASGLGNELDFVPTERHTLRAKKHEDVFVLGDATDLPSSKAGSVAHFQREVLVANLLRTIRGEALEGGFNGHANCFIESGFGRALLIDFNYDVEPLPGHFPIPGVGPLMLLGESRFNHWGKLAFRPIYWN